MAPLVAYLGIDQSLNATGVCRVAHDGSVQILATVDPAKRIDAARLLFIKQYVDSLTHGVKFAALEGYSYDSVGRVFELGEIGGVIKVLLLEQGIDAVVVPPVLLKKFATGSTFAKKDAMIAAARAHGAPIPDGDDNQADAFFLARVARMLVANDASRRCELEVLEALRNPRPKKSKRRVRRLVPAAI